MSIRLRRLACYVASVTIVVSGCSSSGATSPPGTQSAAIDVSALPLLTPGTFTWCSDISYPPAEYYDTDGVTPLGSDIDIANAITKLFNLKSEWINISFDGIIPGVKANKCDASITAIWNTEERRQEVDFVDYLLVGTTLVVEKGNPHNIKSLTDLSGLVLTAQVGSLNYDQAIAANAELQAADKPLITIQTFKEGPEAFQQVLLGRAAAYSTIALVAVYFVNENPDVAELGPTFDPIPDGIVVSKEKPEIRDALQEAIDRLYAEGTMTQIHDKWNMGDAVQLLH